MKHTHHSPNQSPQDTVLIHGATLTGSKELVPMIREASTLQVWRGLAAILMDWSIIVGAMAAAIHFPHPLVWMLAAIVIAGRQHALLVLMHDATHYRLLHNRRWNDRISNWFFAWPLLVTNEGFRSDHLPHHFHLFTEGDSEWVRKRKRVEFQFPMSRTGFLVILAKDLLGFSVFKMCKLLANFSGAQQEQKKLDRRTEILKRVERLAYYAIIVSAIIYFDLLVPVLLLWFLPAFTLLFAILRVRNVAEHSNIGMENDLRMSRSVVAPTLLERLILAPHNVGLHLVHHLYPSIPFYNLRRVHERLMEIPEYASEALTVETYFGIRRSSVLNDLADNRQNEFDLLKKSKIDDAKLTEVLEAAGQEMEQSEKPLEIAS